MYKINQDELRTSSICIGCGGSKPTNAIVCWDCFSYSNLPYKFYESTLEMWLDDKGVKYAECKHCNSRAYETTEKDGYEYLSSNNLCLRCENIADEARVEIQYTPYLDGEFVYE